MQKNVVVAIGLTIGLYFVYFNWFIPKAPVPAPRGPEAPPVAQGTGSVRTPIIPNGAPAAVRGTAAAHPEGPDQTISNGSVELTFATRGGSLRSAHAFGCLYHPSGDRTVSGDPGVATTWVDGLPGALAVELVDASGELPDFAKSHWRLSSADATTMVAEFDHGDFVLTKTVRLSTDAANPWHADCEISLRNVAAKPGATLTLEVVGPVEPRHAPSDTVAGVFIAEKGGSGTFELLHASDVMSQLAENPRLERRAQTGRWAFIGARADFYLGALIPEFDVPADAGVGFRSAMRPDLVGGSVQPAAAATLRLPVTVPAEGAEISYRFTLYSGPNRPSVLADPESRYFILAPASRPAGFLGIELTWLTSLLGWLLAQIAATGMGYGLAVICLTILVRGALFPLSRKSQISMRLHAQRMQKLKPKMDAIKEKYKDTKKQQEATMKLMREEKVSLLPGGCLLAFAQMPVWIALYGVLQTTFEMRHASFLWVPDLTGPDRLLHMPIFADVFFLPEWLNLLPILMMATWYISAAMQPLPDDPQQRSTAKMMRWMPVLMGFFLYSYASGLALYMTMSALWSIGETWLIRKVWLTKLEAALK